MAAHGKSLVRNVTLNGDAVLTWSNVQMLARTWPLVAFLPPWVIHAYMIESKSLLSLARRHVASTVSPIAVSEIPETRFWSSESFRVWLVQVWPQSLDVLTSTLTLWLPVNAA